MPNQPVNNTATDEITFELTKEAQTVGEALHLVRKDLQTYFEESTDRVLSEAEISHQVERTDTGDFKVTLTVVFND